MALSKQIKLGVNIDHVATLREARGGVEPEVLEAARVALDSGADSVTVHLREDRRHIQDLDVEMLKKLPGLIMNLEMAATDEMVSIAEIIKPDYCCIVPEKREELTTEGGLDVVSAKDRIAQACEKLTTAGITVSLFIDPDEKQIEASKEVGAQSIEIHTGHYANVVDDPPIELHRIVDSARIAHTAGLQVNAGHGLTINNVIPIAAIPEIVELNIGHAIIARSIFIGLESAVKEIRTLMLEARS